MKRAPCSRRSSRRDARLARQSRIALVVSITLSLSLACPHLVLAVGPSPIATATGKPAGATSQRLDPSSCPTPATCDGSTNDADALQSCVDALSAGGGGTLVLPGGRLCAIGNGSSNPYVELKDNVFIACTGGGGFKALDGAEAILRSTSATDDVAIDRCRFDLNGKQVPAIDIASGGQIWITNNSVFNPGSTAHTAWNMVKLGCANDNDCKLEGNSLFGAGLASAAPGETCLAVEASGAAYSAGQCTIISNNYIEGCSAEGLSLTRGSGSDIAGCATVTGNTIHGIQESGVHANVAFSTFTGNVIQGGKISGDYFLYDGPGDIQVSGNIMPVAGNGYSFHAVSRSPPGNSTAGIQLDGNYTVRGIYFESRGKCSVTATTPCRVSGDCPAGESCGTYGTFDHNRITGTLCAAATCITIENSTGTSISHNTEIGRGTFLKAVDMDSVADGRSVISDNFINTGPDTIAFDFQRFAGPPEGSGKFDKVVIASNEVIATTGVAVQSGMAITNFTVTDNDFSGVKVAFSPAWSKSMGLVANNNGMPSVDLNRTMLETHASDCASLVTGKKGELCTNENDLRMFLCLPTSGDCATRADWKQIGAASVTFAQLPVAWQSSAPTLVGSVDEMRCVPFVPAVTIAAATKLAFDVTAGAPDKSCGVCIFDGDGTNLLMSSGAQSVSSTGVKRVTGLPPVTLFAGTKYSLCWTCNAMAPRIEGIEYDGSTAQRSLMNSFVTAQGTAAAHGTAGACPATTGAITSADVGAAPAVLLSVE